MGCEKSKRTRAIRVEQFGPPDVLRLIPHVLRAIGPKELLISVQAVGINPSDTYIRAGTYKILPELPFTPGKDAAGLVEAVGSEVHTFRPGDRIFTMGSVSGTYAEHCICHQDHVYPLSDKLTFQQGACLGVPYFTAYRSLFQRGCAKPGETVLIHGATGGVGIAALQLAIDFGLTVIGTGGSEAGLDMIRMQGVHVALNHSQDNYLHGISPVNLVLEMLANSNLNKDLQVLANRGRLCIIGSRGNIDINPRDIMAKEIDVRGIFLPHVPREELEEAAQYICRKSDEGIVRPIIGSVYGLGDAWKAHEDVISHKQGSSGQIVLIPV